MKNNDIFIESVDTKKLSINDIIKIAKVEKDLWAHGIGEYVQCNNCGKIHSKNDIFGHLSDEIKLESVSTIEDILSLDSIKCIECNSDTKFIYDIGTNIEEIKKRLFDTKISFMSVLRNNNNGDIHGFMDGYIDDFSTIYKNEFIYHYDDIGIENIFNIVNNFFKGELEENLFTISSIGTEEKYKGLSTFLGLINSFVSNIPKEYNNYTGFVEFDTGSNIHAIYNVMGFNNIPIIDEYKSLINNKSSNYNSGLYYLENMIGECKNIDFNSIRGFIKMYGDKMKEVLVDK